MVSMCWDFTACGCGAGTKMAVVPSALRMNQAYVVFYVTWAWAFFTCRYTICVFKLFIYDNHRFLAHDGLVHVEHQGVHDYADDEAETGGKEDEQR